MTYRNGKAVRDPTDVMILRELVELRLAEGPIGHELDKLDIGTTAEPRGAVQELT